MDPPELIDLVNTERIVQKYLPKKDIERNTPSYNHKGDPSRIFE